MREAFEYVKTSGTKSDLVNFLASYNTELGLEDAELYKRSVDLALSVELSTKNALRLVRQIVRLAPGQDETTVKSDLKKLNRAFSPNLVKDKESWEPVVATIRTALETY